jgi:hypothetical protein
MAARFDDPLKAAERLELHLCREFVRSYIRQAMGKHTVAKIDTNKLISAARVSGIKAPSRVVIKVLDELVR